MRGILIRYRHLLPLTSKTPLVSLEEGSTPLIPLDSTGKDLGIRLFAKFEGANPTGSFKDRGMVLAVAKAIEAGARGLVCASTGNTSASAAAYAARTGIPCTVLLPGGKVAMGKLAQAMVYGARVISLKGNFDRALELALEVSRELGLAVVNSVNRYRLWGQRSVAWEICDELGHPPDVVVLPVGNAGNITASWAGFVQYSRIGKIGRIPAMFGVQAEGAAPLALGKPCPEPETVATAIRIGRPVNGKKARWAVRMSGGRFLSVSDGEILDAQKRLAACEGVFAEPASCAGIAGLYRLASQNGLSTGKEYVAVLTGNGLKDTDAATSGKRPPVEVDAELKAIREVLL
ncbi:MAG: threonine synthase [Thermovirgaceae bacterium]|jgi:threonine synthase|nr:threonine synthase [Synergistales bacterium]MDI9393796.1 threonine synthase [Synergistota bacterium]MDY0179381.1 threonine synthase [Synergistaceae bacterium]HRW88075.1 threonine synthase [Thermovirgaceae bacterium]MDD3134138.1 threonine synthase [Synergistales bacterium]